MKKELPDEKTMLEALEEARMMEKAIIEMAEMAYSAAYKIQKLVAEFRSEASQEHGQQTTR